MQHTTFGAVDKERPENNAHAIIDRCANHVDALSSNKLMWKYALDDYVRAGSCGNVHMDALIREVMVPLGHANSAGSQRLRISPGPTVSRSHDAAASSLLLGGGGESTRRSLSDKDFAKLAEEHHQRMAAANVNAALLSKTQQKQPFTYNMLCTER